MYNRQRQNGPPQNGQQNGYQNRSQTNQRQEPEEHQESEQKEDSRKPVHQLNYPTGSGSFIWISIWENVFDANGEQKVYFSVTYKRSYFHDKKWKTAENVRSNELHVLIHALNQASIWCLEATRT